MKSITVTKEQEKFIRENYSTTMRKNICEEINITIGVLNYNMTVMGLTSPRKDQPNRKKKIGKKGKPGYFDETEYFKTL